MKDENLLRTEIHIIMKKLTNNNIYKWYSFLIVNYQPSNNINSNSIYTNIIGKRISPFHQISLKSNKYDLKNSYLVIQVLYI